MVIVVKGGQKSRIKEFVFMDLQCLRNFSNCNILITPEVEMAIWEPCNYVSNLAYDRLLVEMCVQQVWLICFRIFHNLKFGNIFVLLCFYQS